MSRLNHAITPYRHGFRQHMENRQREIAAEHNYNLVRIDTLHRQRKFDLADAVMARRNVFSFGRCVDAIVQHYGVSREKLLSSKREVREIAEARQHLYWLLYNERSDLTLPAIGQLVGRDHSTVQHGIIEFNKRHPDRDTDTLTVHSLVWRIYNEQKVQAPESARHDEPQRASNSGDAVPRDKPAEDSPCRYG